MVCRARILLILALSGCKAETLGVDVPEGGRQSISQEDLQRDVWMLEQLGDRRQRVDEAARAVQSRFSQMHTRPGFDRSFQQTTPEGGRVVCAERDGQADQPVLIFAEDPGAGAAAGAVPVAVLISLAKGFDTLQLPEQRPVFCALLGPGALAQFLQKPPTPLDGLSGAVQLGPLVSPPLEQAASELGALSVVKLTAGQLPDPDVMESLDYRELLALTLQIFDTVAATPAK